MKPLPAGDTRDYPIAIKQQDGVTPFDLTGCTVTMIFGSARKPIVTLTGSIVGSPGNGNASSHLGPTDSATLAQRHQTMGAFDVRVKVLDVASQTWTVFEDTLEVT